MEGYREMTSETVDRVEMAEALRILQKLKGERLSHVRKLSFPQGEMRVYPLRDGEEAWRFFSQNRQRPHLVASFRPNGTGRPDAVTGGKGKIIIG